MWHLMRRTARAQQQRGSIWSAGERAALLVLGLLLLSFGLGTVQFFSSLLALLIGGVCWLFGSLLCLWAESFRRRFILVPLVWTIWLLGPGPGLKGEGLLLGCLLMLALIATLRRL